MSGVTKHIYEHDIRDVISMWNRQIHKIQEILPQNFSKEDIIDCLKLYYPHEWHSVEIKYKYYSIKDKYIKKMKGKTRYNMDVPERLLCRVPIFKRIMLPEYRENYSKNYSQDIVTTIQKSLESERRPKIERINRKIESAKTKTQQVTPEFIDCLFGLYERKNTLQKDKVYILLELKKYYNEKTIQFFYKLNDTELNKQLREEAFRYLQSFNYQPRLRKQKYMQVHTKNRKRKRFLKTEYPEQKYVIPMNPEELEYRIENSREQNIKTYDYFISHSSKDRESVQKLITEENHQGKNIYCDWISDVDYLKRHLVCEATLKVIEKRLEQSDALIFVDSDNSKKSPWCIYELNYFFELHKPIFSIDKKDIENGFFILTDMEDVWFFNPDYKRYAIQMGSLIGSDTYITV